MAFLEKLFNAWETEHDAVYNSTSLTTEQKSQSFIRKMDSSTCLNHMPYHEST